MIKKINKKGDSLPPEALGVIVAFLGLILIGIAGYKLLNASLDQESENAKRLLENINGKIENLKEDEIGRFTFRGIEGWQLTAWSKSDANRPDKCFFESCICICKSDNNLDRKEECQSKNGFCKNIDIENSFSGNFVNYKNDLISIERFFENPEKYDVYDHALGQEKYYIAGREIFFPKGNSIFEIIARKSKDKLYIIKWDYEGGPESIQPPLPDYNLK